MRARSLKAWMELPENAHFGIDVSSYQTLETLSPTYRFGVDLYNWIQLKAPWLHHLYFNILEVASLHSKATRISAKAAKRFSEKIAQEQPRLIVSTHAHLNHGFFELARETLGASVRCITYCGELYGGYGFCRHWVNPQADGFFGAVQPCCDQARKLGMPDAKNHLGGFLLNPAFWQEPEPKAIADQWIRETFQLDPSRFILVLATGANSANNHTAMLDALANARMVEPQILALCGKNTAARNAVTQWAEANPAYAVRASAQLSSAEICRVFRASGAVVARPGTGTTSEAILSGCPIIHNGIGGIMPQEWITVKFMAAHGLKRVIRRARDLPEQLKPLLDKPTWANAHRAMLAARPDAHPQTLVTQLHALTQSNPSPGDVE